MLFSYFYVNLNIYKALWSRVDILLHVSDFLTLFISASILAFWEEKKAGWFPFPCLCILNRTLSYRSLKDSIDIIIWRYFRGKAILGHFVIGNELLVNWKKVLDYKYFFLFMYDFEYFRICPDICFLYLSKVKHHCIVWLALAHLDILTIAVTINT